MTNNNNNNNNKLINSLINRIAIIRSFYVKPEDFPILQEFLEVARREAGPRGFSQVILNAMKEYNQKHRIGNPQKLLFPVTATAHELESQWLQCMYSANDHNYGTDYPLAFCSLRRTFVGMNYQRCQNCNLFKRRT